MAKVENLYTPDCIRTFTGRYVNVFEPTPDMFCIEDIAHALAFQCRFGAHLPRFYTVAQHSLMVSIRCEDAFSGLMHDCSEAYLLDLPKPIKDRIPEYKAIEKRLMQHLSKVFGFAYPFPNEVKKADREAMEIEWENVFLRDNIIVSRPEYAEQLFLERFNELQRCQ